MMTQISRSRAASLRERILQATTASEIDALLAEGTTYKAKARTRSLWMRAAEERKNQLGDWRP